MKFKTDDRYNTIAAYVMLVILFNILIILILVNLGVITGAAKVLFDAVKPLLYAVFFAFMLSPLEKFFEKHLPIILEKKKPHPKLKKFTAIIMTYLITLLFLTAFGFIIVPQITDSYIDFQSKILTYVGTAQSWVSDIVGSSEFFADQYNRIVTMLEDLVNNSYDMFQTYSPYIVNFIKAFLTEAMNIILGLLFSIYFIIYKEKVIAQFKKLIRAFCSEKTFKDTIRLFRFIGVTFNEFIVGKMLDSILIGLLCYILMMVCMLPYAPFVSVIIGVTAFIPFIGMYIGAIPGIFIIFLASPIKVIWFLLIIIALQQLDSNVIEPRILSEKHGLSTLWVLTSIIIMGGFLGVWGLIIGVPFVTVIYAIFKDIVEKRLEKRGLPSATEDYIN
jgi:predicted PurR-regulated permease PerM